MKRKHLGQVDDIVPRYANEIQSHEFHLSIMKSQLNYRVTIGDSNLEFVKSETLE